MKLYRSKKWLALMLVMLTCFGPVLPSFSYAADTNFPNIDKSYSLSMVVSPQKDGISDKASDTAAKAIREALPQIFPIHIISDQIVQDVLSYYLKDSGALSPQKDSAADNLTRAKDHYFNFQYDIARVEAKRAIEILEKGKISENGAMLQDAYLTCGIIAKAQGNKELAQESFARAARLDPLYYIDHVNFPPSIVAMYENEQRQVLQGVLGSLKVETNPPAAEVYINGIIQGVTPLKLSRIPSGTYNLIIKTNKYETIEQEVKITSGKETVIDKKLMWAYGPPAKDRRVRAENARVEINEALRIADLLKADKAVLVNCYERGESNTITARMVDRKYRSSYRQLIAYYETPEQKAQAITDITYALAQQAKANILSNPQKYLDKDGIGDPVLLGKRKKELHKRPLFWGAIGTAAAGALVGGLLAAFSGGSSPDKGSLAVEFK